MSTYLHQLTYLPMSTYQHIPTHVNLPSSIYLPLPIPTYQYIIAADPGAGIGLVSIGTLFKFCSVIIICSLASLDEKNFRLSFQRRTIFGAKFFPNLFDFVQPVFGVNPAFDAVAVWEKMFWFIFLKNGDFICGQTPYLSNNIELLKKDMKASICPSG